MLDYFQQHRMEVPWRKGEALPCRRDQPWGRTSLLLSPEKLHGPGLRWRNRHRATEPWHRNSPEQREQGWGQR
ncbi:hypothetical protein Nmel_011438 [Mimus melanotis]